MACNAVNLDYSFIVLTESWLHPNVHTSELGLYNYNIFRFDRCLSTSNCARGGGVLIGVKKNIASILITTPIINVEHIFVQFTISSFKYVIGGVYFPPNSPLDCYEQYISSVEQVLQQYPDHTYIFAGDFNLPDTSWSNDRSGLWFSSTSNLRVPCIPESFAYFGFFQKNCLLNTHGSLLDLIFCSSNEVTVIACSEPLIPPDPYHPPLLIHCPGSTNLPPFKNAHSYHNFRKANYPNIIKFMSSFDWTSTFANHCVDSAVNIFMDALHSSILQFVPLVHFTNSAFPVWASRELKQLVRLKNNAHALFKSTFDPLDYITFSQLRAKCKRESRKCYRNFIKSTEYSLVSRPKKFWDFVRKNRSTSAIPNVLRLNNHSSTNEQETVDLFALHFSSVYSSARVSTDLESLNIPLFDLPNTADFSAENVLLKLTALRGITSVGPDGIQGDFIYQLRQVIFFPLWLLFRQSLHEGVFPAIWKISHITPILKSGDISDVTNYRPISILSHLSKTFESLVLDSIMPSLNPVLIDEQHGFRPGRSTETCNVTFTKYIYDAFKSGSQVDVIYTDFTKAFDSVNHEILVSVLEALGFGYPFLGWIRSYLFGRPQWVKLYGTKSQIFTASSGVPQGGHLSPILFSLFINSVSNIPHHCKLLCFADDIKLFLRVDSLIDCTHLQEDLDRFVVWGNAIGLSLNVNKCKSMSFARCRSLRQFSYSIMGSVLNSVDTVTSDLGFIIVPSLSPAAHIDHITCKAFRTLGFIKRIASEFELSRSLKALYCALVRSTLEYGSVVWNPQSLVHSQSIERVQRKFLSFAGFKLNIYHPPHDYGPVSRRLNLPSLADRRSARDSLFLQNLICGKIDSPSLLQHIHFRVPARHTRNVAPFAIPTVSANYLSNEPLTRCMRQANLDPSFSYLL